MASKPGTVITVLYKRTPDLKFDMDYYQNSHLHLARRMWGPRGLLADYSVLPSEDADFAFSLTMFWTSLSAWEEANKVDEEMKEIMSDVPNFTNGDPNFVVGKLIGQG